MRDRELDLAQLVFVTRGFTNVRLRTLLEIATCVGALAGGIAAALAMMCLGVVLGQT